MIESGDHQSIFMSPTCGAALVCGLGLSLATTFACNPSVGTSVVAPGDVRVFNQTGGDTTGGDATGGDYSSTGGDSSDAGGDHSGTGGDSPGPGGDSSGTGGDSPDPGDSAGVECTDPIDCTTPGACETPPGACNAGHCEYPLVAATTVCNDGDPCTDNDDCDALGTCAGTDVVCGGQPAAECQANEYVYWVDLGGCDPVSGDCYQEVRFDCGNDCLNDCLNICSGVSCPAQNGGCRLGACVPIPPVPPAGPSYQCVYTDAADGVVCNVVTGVDESCFGGACKECATNADCPPCANCGTTGTCDVAPADDSRCGTIDCDGLDDLPCRNYHDLTAGRCEGLADCKDANTADCADLTDAPSGTDCELCLTCDGSGACSVVPADDPACPVIDCKIYETSYPCRTYTDIATNRCKGPATCKETNDCTYIYRTGSCDDGDPCTGNGTCVSGVCSAGSNNCIPPQYCAGGAGCQNADLSWSACETGGGFDWVNPWVGNADAANANCCGDDGGEYYKIETTFTGSFTGAPLLNPANDACCDTATDCVNSAKACLADGDLNTSDAICSNGGLYVCQSQAACLVEETQRCVQGGATTWNWLGDNRRNGSNLIQILGYYAADYDSATGWTNATPIPTDTWSCCVTSTDCSRSTANDCSYSGNKTSAQWMCYDRYWYECAANSVGASVGASGVGDGVFKCMGAGPAWAAQ